MPKDHDYTVWSKNQKKPIYYCKNHEEAVGKLVNYVACAGGSGIMLSPPEADKTYVVAERQPNFEVKVTICGTATAAMNVLERVR